jgi:hypothetical protein
MQEHNDNFYIKAPRAVDAKTEVATFTDLLTKAVGYNYIGMEVITRDTGVTYTLVQGTGTAPTNWLPQSQLLVNTNAGYTARYVGVTQDAALTYLDTILPPAAVTIRTDQLWVVSVELTAVDITNKVCYIKEKFVYNNLSGTPTAIDRQELYKVAKNASIAALVDIGFDGNDVLYLSVTGEVGATYHWEALVHINVIQE